MADNFYVYQHCRLDTGKPFYIGKGRVGRCISESSRNPQWQRIVQKTGGFATDFLAQDLPEELALLAEVEAIDVYRKRGGVLANLTHGGDGTSGLRHSEASRRRMSEAHRGVPLTEAHRLNAARSRIGTRCSDDTTAKLSARNSGRVMTTEQRQKLSAAKVGKTLTEEHRARIAAGVRANPPRRRIGPSPMRGKHFSQEARANMSAAHLGHKVSEETRAKLSAAAKAQWARRIK